MGKVWFQLSVSLDGYSAGPNQSRDDPIGVGGMRLSEWGSSRSMCQGPSGSGRATSRREPSDRRSLKHRNRTPARSSRQDRSTSTGSSTPASTMLRGTSSARDPA